MPRAMSNVWDAYTVTHVLASGSSASGSGTRRWACKYCGKSFSTTTTRLISHVSGVGGGGIFACEKVPPEIAEAIKNEHRLAQQGKEARRREMEATYVELMDDVDPSHSEASQRARTVSQRDEEDESTSPSCHPPPMQRPKQGSLHSSMLSSALQKQRQKVVEIEIERCILQCNLSFNVVRTDAWRRMVKIIAQVGPCDDWHGVEYNRLRGPMLDEEKDRIEVQLEPIRLGWKTYGCSIISDGWSDTRRLHIINILVSSYLCTYFLRAIDASRAGVRITGDFIFEHIKTAILEIGVENVVQVIIDNASNCKRMGKMVEKEFPSIVWTPCASHCLDLLFEDIGKLSWLAPLVSDAKRIVTFIRKNHLALAIFRCHSLVDMIRPVDTRFAYIYMVFHRLHEVSNVLRISAIDHRWISMHTANTELARYVQRKVLDDVFCADIAALVPVLRYIYIVLCIVDKEGSTLGLVYHMYTTMREAISSSTTLSLDRFFLCVYCSVFILYSFIEHDIIDLVDARWRTLCRPIHGFSALLYPFFKGPTLWAQTMVGLERVPNAYEAYGTFCTKRTFQKMFGTLSKFFFSRKQKLI
ncbi:hypothetical protein KP509_39G033300 [Ceratopteris richardii]|uniref:BED-type domain-containing protein n=1 Tax=Ceratopteris richardii TaxID=49495 RepID=A0A8T2Q0C0_CERRI|nr:hypothetical protein KP509_39G033300 [Ceratopteris richardii]